MDPLAQPIGFLMRPTFTVDLQDSLELAARKLRENGCDVLPVTENGVLAGTVSELALAEALGSGLEMTDAVKEISKGALTAKPSISGAEALRLFENQRSAAIIIIDDSARILGLLTPSDLYPKRAVPPRPPLVGGMATPFGVYLTTGSLRAGVGHLALVTTGLTLFGLLFTAQIASFYLSVYINRHGVSDEVANAIQSSLPFLVFLAGMRLMPLSGIHAAEHKVVHAIERGEELVPSTVKRMPRVHPRCGTNLAVGASIFMGICLTEAIPSLVLRTVLGAVATLSLWRPLGNIAQYYVTTKRPNDKQIGMGIRSGKELLEKYASSGSAGANVLQRIFYSGMLHVLAGGALVVGVFLLVAWACHLNLPIG